MCLLCVCVCVRASTCVSVCVCVRLTCVVFVYLSGDPLFQNTLSTLSKEMRGQSNEHLHIVSNLLTKLYTHMLGEKFAQNTYLTCHAYTPKYDIF